MPLTPYLKINVGGYDLEIGDRASLGLSISYALEDSENFEQKQSSMSLGIEVPATPANDKAFNTFSNPNVEDLTTGQIYTNPRACTIRIAGVEVLTGKALLSGATHTDMPEDYTINSYGNNGDWALDMRDLTLWDCLDDQPHDFSYANVIHSWGAFGSDEHHDFVYAPVRYRQPFGDNDDIVTIFHLRPSLSIYWMIVRAFRQFGYRIDSTFFNTAFFKGLVMPWTWGDFYDINSQITDVLRFKAAGKAPPLPPLNATLYQEVIDQSIWTNTSQGLAHPQLPGGISRYWYSAQNIPGVDMTMNGGHGPGGSMYVFNTVTRGYNTIIEQQTFIMDDDFIPLGYDNSALYTFDSATGTMQWSFTPPSYYGPQIGNNITANFALNLLAELKAPGAGASNTGDLVLEATKVPLVGPSIVTTYPILHAHNENVGSVVSPTVVEFSVSGINQGDILKFRLKWIFSTNIQSLDIVQAAYLNTTVGGPVATWQLITSTFELTSLQVVVGGPVHFKWYDKFRSYKFLDMFCGLADLFNLSVQTDAINKVVCFEPTHDYKTPTDGAKPGYFKAARIDWTNKQDVSKKNELTLFSDVARQYDFQFKQDGSDGGQNIYSARYKGIYLNNVTNTPINNNSISNGMMAAVPGSSRYLFPARFQRGNKSQTNRFFSATMHFRATQWTSITGVAPQLIAIIPENISDSSASAISATFEPKIAFYKGYVSTAQYGGWKFMNDFNTLETPPGLPFLFSVNYGYNGQNDPVLSYCDQNINGVVAPGLMRSYFLKRLATMRSGKLYKPWVKLELTDVTDWYHRNTIMLRNALYNLIKIDNYKPLDDESCQCTMWKVTNPEQQDLDNCFPSADSITNNPPSLQMYDLKYAPLLLFTTDLPQL